MGAWLLGVLISTMTLAQTPESIRFTKWSDVKSPSSELSKYREAVKSINSGSGPASCTATAISNDGYMLTARHCLTKCMFRSQILEEQPVAGGATSYYTFSQEKAKTAECKIQIDGEDHVIQVVASSPGLIMAMNEKSVATLDAELYKTLVAEGYTDWGDFAIFKVKDLKKKQTCVPLSDRAVQVGDVQQTLGYPGETNRPDGSNSDGTSLYYSKGYVVPSIFDIACVKGNNFTQFQVENIIRNFTNPTSFMTSVDAIYGSSGSSVLGPDNKIAGILVSIFRLAEFTKLETDEPDVRYCEGSTRALSIDTVRASLAKQGFDLSAIQCNQE